MIDLRIPVGLFFSVIGAVLAVDGSLHPAFPPGVALNINRDWGIVLFVFGALMTMLGGAAGRRSRRSRGE